MSKSELIANLDAIVGAFIVRDDAQRIINNASPQAKTNIKNMIKEENVKKVRGPRRIHPIIFLKNLFKAGFKAALIAAIIAVIAFFAMELSYDKYRVIFWIICGIILIASYISASREDRENIKAAREQARKHNEWVDSRKAYYKECQQAHSDAKAQYNEAKETYDRYNKLIAFTSDKIGIHQKYRSKSACAKLKELLETGRADSLKEAINLYENLSAAEKRNRQSAQHDAEMRQLQAAQINSINAMRQEQRNFQEYQYKMDTIDDLEKFFDGMSKL